MTTASAQTDHTATRVPAGPLFTAGAVAGLVGGIAALLVALVAQALGVSMEVAQPGGGVAPAPLPGFVISTLVAALIGAALGLGVQRWSARPARTFAVVTAVLVVLSFAQPLLLAQDTATALTLMVTHVVAAAVVIPALVRRLPQRR